MKNIYLLSTKTLFILFIVGLAPISQSCEIEKICKSVEVADLICEDIFFDKPTVETGAAFLITTVVRNVSYQFGCPNTRTMTATASTTGMRAEYRETPQADWEPAKFELEGASETIEVLPVSTKALEPDFNTGFRAGINFAKPGEYRISAVADYRKRIEERDENNNENKTGNGVMGRSLDSEDFSIIKVEPSLEYHQSKNHSDKPIITYQGIEILW